MTRLIALEDVKPLLPIRSGNTSYDARLDGLILTVSRMIETECRTKFEKSERVEYHTPRDTSTRTLNLYGDGAAYNYGASEQIIPLRAAPVDPVAPVSLWYDPLHQFTDDTLIDEDRYHVDPDMQRVVLRYPTRRILSALKVQYTAGFAAGYDDTLTDALSEQAPDLKQAAILGVLHLFKRSENDIVGTTKSGDDQNKGQTPATANSYGLPKEALVLISPYRRVLTGRG